MPLITDIRTNDDEAATQFPVDKSFLQKDIKDIQDEIANILVAASPLTFAVYVVGKHPWLVTYLRPDILEKRWIKDTSFRGHSGYGVPASIPECSSKVGTTLPKEGHAPYYVPNGSLFYLTYGARTPSLGSIPPSVSAEIRAPNLFGYMNKCPRCRTMIRTGNERLWWRIVLGAPFRDEYDLKGVEA
ncbi:hypothetical protein F5146DRAFT_1006891 [Armillaria mellea]|nr:hypothetical protein F5146DRAFT_1006891 [Armillaria mellea]